MNIIYKNNKIQKACEDFSVAKREYGENNAIKLHKAIKLLIAADDIEMLLRTKMQGCHRLVGDREGQYAMTLEQPFRLVFKIVNDEIHIISVKILEITNYHDR